MSFYIPLIRMALRLIRYLCDLALGNAAAEAAAEALATELANARKKKL